MLPKWAKKANFGDISYNLMSLIEENFQITLWKTYMYFTILSQIDNFNENNQQKCIIVVYVHNIYKHLCARFWCYRVYHSPRFVPIEEHTHVGIDIRLDYQVHMVLVILSTIK